MDKTEILEISDAFKEAWEDFFGAPMYLVIFDETTEPNMYLESKRKKYKVNEKHLFHGTLKELEDMDEERPIGKRIDKTYVITFVTKELVEQGITKIDSNSIIEFTDPYDNTFKYKIADDYKKVQFNAYHIFTKLKVVSCE